MKVAISSGHGKYISGAVGPSPWGLDEHKEAVRVVDRVAALLNAGNVPTQKFEDTVSRSQNENLKRICDWHNAQTRDYDVSIHFNAASTTQSPRGTECYYYSQNELAAKVSAGIAQASTLINRGAKKNTGLYFLNHTNEPAILVEICFVDSKADADLYNAHFDAICSSIAKSLGAEAIPPEPIPPEPIPPEPVPPLPVAPATVNIITTGAVRVIVNGVEITPAPTPPVPPAEVLFETKGKCSWFGGPNDTGVSASEGLAFIYKYEDAPHLFLSYQPSGTSGLARRLNPDVLYVACRWDYAKTPKSMLIDKNRKALLSAKGKQIWAWPADWGPHTDTGRVTDLSPAAMKALGVATDDAVEVVYPVPEEAIV